MVLQIHNSHQNKSICVFGITPPPEASLLYSFTHSTGVWEAQEYLSNGMGLPTHT